MRPTHFETFGRTVQKTNEWLNELRSDLGWDDQHRAYAALKAVLHALRDRLTVEEAVELGAQLPMLVRGFYYEGWRPAGKPLKERHLEEFLARLEGELGRRFEPPLEPIVEAVFRLLDHRITAGEIEDVKGILPREVRSLWPEYAPATSR